jgi:hypothetical protein
LQRWNLKDVFKPVTAYAEPLFLPHLGMDDTVMSYSASASPTDSVAHWIDTSLVSDPALLNLMTSYNWTPFLGHELGSSSSLAQDEFAITTNQAATNNFGLANGFGTEYTLSETQRKSSTVKSDATSESFSALEQPFQATERPAIDEVAKAKKEVSERWSFGSITPSAMDLTFTILETSRAKSKGPASFQATQGYSDSPARKRDAEIEVHQCGT